MEHVISIGISVDDDAIKKAAEKEAAKQISKAVVGHVFSTDWSGNPMGFREWTEEIIKSIFKEHKEEIISMASKMVADTITRSKRYREAVAEICDKE